MADRLIYGIHPVRRLLRGQSARIRRVYLQQDLADQRHGRIAQDLGRSGVTVRRVSREELEKLTGTEKHQGIAALTRGVEPLGESEALDLVRGLAKALLLVLDGVQDPRNFGACLRTADAAGVDLVVTGRSRNVGITPVVSKVASGAAETLPQAQVANLARFLAQLREAGVWIVGADAGGEQSLFDADLTGPVALVLGAEDKGLRRLTRHNCDFVVHLPMAGTVESLNVAVAAGICLYEARRQRSAPG